MQGSGITQPVKFLTSETPLSVFGSQSCTKREKLLTIILRLKSFKKS